MIEINSAPEYSVAHGIIKSGGHGILGFVCYVVAAHLPFVGVGMVNPAAGALFVAAEFIRNALKIRIPKFFSWL